MELTNQIPPPYHHHFHLHQQQTEPPPQAAADGEDRDGWVESALGDDALVARLLLRLSSPKLPELRWGMRQPRSRQPSKIIFRLKEADDFTRASPTTPLSWSGASSGDAACPLDTPLKRLSPDSAHAADHHSRSRINGGNPNLRLTIRTKKKKTYDELKYEEHLLLMEKANLTKEFESVKATCEDLKLKNEKLKKLKVDIELQSAVEAPNYASDLPLPPPPPVFELPDLNLVPSEDDSGSDVLCGMS